MKPSGGWVLVRRTSVMLTGALVLALVGCNQSGRPGSDSPGYSSPTAAAAATAPPATLNGSSTLYAVIPGDTVYGVAERFGVPTRTLIDVNGLIPPYRMAAGQKLRVPARQEHMVQPGESLFAIARIYAVDQSSLARVNQLSPPYRLQAGQRLVLPGRVEGGDPSVDDDLASIAPVPTTAPATDAADGAMTVEEISPPTTESSDNTTSSTAPPDEGLMDLPLPPDSETAAPPAQPAGRQQALAVPEPPPRSASQFMWPLNGKLVSRFGPKNDGLHNDGINISAPRGTRVVAAENGVVAYAGNELRGFGNLLLIKHADGWITAYAHNDKLLVGRGDKVTRGQAIARVGSSGNVSSPQLHFEIRRGAEPVDPMKYLGAEGASLNPVDGPAGPLDPG